MLLCQHSVIGLFVAVRIVLLPLLATAQYNKTHPPLSSPPQVLDEMMSKDREVRVRSAGRWGSLQSSLVTSRGGATGCGVGTFLTLKRVTGGKMAVYVEAEKPLEKTLRARTRL